MTDKPDHELKGREALDEISKRLGTLGVNLKGAFDVIADVVEAAEKNQSSASSGDAGQSHSDFTVNTAKGPMQARASWGLRTGPVGAPRGGASGSDFKVEPVNAGRKKSPAEDKPAREPHVEVYQEGEAAFVITVELPGIGDDALKLERVEGGLELSADGRTSYRTRVDIPEAFQAGALEHRLQNGVLEIRISSDQ